jgi:hypothetical protein
MNENRDYPVDQLASVFAKIEVAKMLTEMGAKLAKEAATDLSFFKITNEIPDSKDER